MATQNSWNNQVIDNAVLFNGGTFTVSSDAVNRTIDIGTGAAVKTVTLGSTNTTSATTVQSGSGNLSITSTNGALNINSGTGTISLSTDASNTTVALGTGAAVKTVTVGSTNTTSATTVQSGSGALNVTSTNGALTINSGTGTLGISTDASATTVNIASGAAAKTLQVGSTTGASALNLKCGTGDFTLASATGNIISAADTGEINYPLQPAFRAQITADQNNVTGDGTTYTIQYNNEIFDQNGDFNTGTYTFTAPVTGRYMLCASAYLAGIPNTTTFVQMNMVTSNRTSFHLLNTIPTYKANGEYTPKIAELFDMDAADTATVQVLVGGVSLVVDVINAGGTSFSGYLVA